MAPQAPQAPQLCVGALAVDEGRLLMVRRGRSPAAGRWSIPGGRVERGETLAQAVVRELAEETGVQAVCEGLAGWVERMGPDHHFVILDFWVQVRAPADLVAGDDATEVAWVPLTEVRELDLVDGLDEFLTDQAVLDKAGAEVVHDADRR